MINLDNMFKRMKSMNITQKKMAELTGISQGNISDWKNGRSIPSLTTADKIANILECSIDYIAGRTENPEINK